LYCVELGVQRVLPVIQNGNTSKTNFNILKRIVSFDYFVFSFSFALN